MRWLSRTSQVGLFWEHCRMPTMCGCQSLLCCSMVRAALPAAGCLLQQGRDPPLASQHTCPMPSSPLAISNPACASAGRYSRYGQQVGSGRFKLVYKGFDEKQGIDVAWSKIEAGSNNLSHEQMVKIVEEISYGLGLDHPHIIKVRRRALEVPCVRLGGLRESAQNGACNSTFTQSGSYAGRGSRLQGWQGLACDPTGGSGQDVPLAVVAAGHATSPCQAPHRTPHPPHPHPTTSSCCPPPPPPPSCRSASSVGKTSRTAAST
jgi:hypothetical protein